MLRLRSFKATSILCVTILISFMNHATAMGSRNSTDRTEATFDQILSKAAKEGNTRITGSYTYGRFKGESLHGFRGVIDYHLPARGPFFNWSIALTGHFSLNEVDSLSQHFAGAGANLHVFNWYDLDIFGGGAVGFTQVDHDVFETRYPLTLNIHGGWTIYGDFLCFSGEIGYRHGEYFSRDHKVYIDLSHFYISFGMGVKL